MRPTASSGGAGALPLLALLVLTCGCDLVSGLSDFDISDAGGGPACDPGTFSPGCPGSVGWALPISSEGNVYVTAVISNAAGRTYVALALDAEATLAETPAPHVGGWDAAVVALNPDGSVRWLQSVVGTGEDRVVDLAMSSDGDLLVAGNFVADVTVAGTLMQDPELGGSDAFLVKLAAVDGSLRWKVQYSGVGPQTVEALAADAEGYVYVVGAYAWQLTLDDGGAGETTAGDFNAFVDKREPDGQEGWHLALGDSQDQRARSVAVTSAGYPIVAGEYRGTIAFDVDSTISAGVDTDLFVAQLRPAGNGDLWSRSFSAPGNEIIYTVALDAEDRVFLAGKFDSALQLDRPLTTNQPVLFAAALSSAGVPRWSLDFPGTVELPFTQRMLAVDRAANLFLTGTFQDDAFVGTTLTSVLKTDDTPSRDVFTASFDADGETRWTRPFGGDGDDVAGAVALVAGGDVLFAGGYQGAIDLDQPEVFVSAGGTNAYLIRVAP